MVNVHDNWIPPNQTQLKSTHTSGLVKDPIRSATLLSTLCHPSVIAAISSFPGPSVFYQVTEFCHNGNLEEYLVSRGTRSLTEGELRGVARTLVDALRYLRGELILHRDIKPTNILLTRDFRLVNTQDEVYITGN